MVDGERGVRRFVMRESAQRNQFAGIGRNINKRKRLRPLLQVRSYFQNHVVLVQAFINI